MPDQLNTIHVNTPLSIQTHQQTSRRVTIVRNNGTLNFVAVTVPLFIARSIVRRLCYTHIVRSRSLLESRVCCFYFITYILLYIPSYHYYTLGIMNHKISIRNVYIIAPNFVQ